MGVLALQGGYAEHVAMFERLGVAASEVRLPRQLDQLDAVVIPGGESTTIGKLAVQYGLMDALRAFAQSHAIWGTCAGAILLSKDVRRKQPLLELMDMTVRRNAFGSQLDSFEVDIDINTLTARGRGEAPFHAVFIRAPVIETVSEAVLSLATLPDGRVVAARQGRWLATCFHPELTDDTRLHEYFLRIASGGGV